MFQRRVFVAASSAVLRLIIAFLVGSGSPHSSTTVASCSHLVFDDRYACNVTVTPSSTDDDSAAAVVMTSNCDQVPRNASALRLTLYIRPATALGSRNGSRTNLSVPLTYLPLLRSLDVDVSETRSFPAGLLSKLGAISLLQLNVYRSASTEYQLRIPTEEMFATSNSSLTRLVLSGLGIEQLPVKTFEGLTTLCSLSVNKNRLSSLPAGLFDDLCQLSSLSLAGNRFVDVEDLSLIGRGCGLSRLRSLDLHGNRLQQLRASVFRSLRSVVEINLSENELSVIEDGTFSGLLELRTLYIDKNQLVTVMPMMFDGLTRLETLDISSNRLSNISSGSFQYLTALRTLSLRENEIQFIRSDAWTGLDKLTDLDLASNRLTAVDKSTFTGLCSLHYVDLSDNKVTVARADTFMCLTALEQLDLSGNLLSGAELHRSKERQWWSKDVGTGPPASCDKCWNWNASMTTTSSAETNSTYPAADPHRASPSPSPSSLSAVLRLATTQMLAVLLPIGAMVAVALFLKFAVALYKRRRTVFDCQHHSTTSTYRYHSDTVCTLDNSIDGIYVKIHT